MRPPLIRDGDRSFGGGRSSPFGRYSSVKEGVDHSRVDTALVGGCPVLVGMKLVTKVMVRQWRLHSGVYFAQGKQNALCTPNLLVHGESFSNDHIISATFKTAMNEGDENEEFRVWSPFRSTLAAAIFSGLDYMDIEYGSRVLYLGAGSGISVSHVSDIVADAGVVYAVEYSHGRGRDLVNMAKKRTNVHPIIEDARNPAKYRMVVNGMVDVIVSDIALPDQAQILAMNASYFLKAGGHFFTFIKANCIDSSLPAKAVFASEVKKLKADQFTLYEQVTLEPFKRDVACIVGSNR